jgi:hypothetical protein
MKYKVNWSKDGSLHHIRESAVLDTFAIASRLAVAVASQTKPKIRSVTILRDSEGEDHPSNAGQFFLHSIVK